MKKHTISCDFFRFVQVSNCFESFTAKSKMNEIHKNQNLLEIYPINGKWECAFNFSLYYNVVTGIKNVESRCVRSVLEKTQTRESLCLFVSLSFMYWSLNSVLLKVNDVYGFHCWVRLCKVIFFIVRPLLYFIAENVKSIIAAVVSPLVLQLCGAERTVPVKVTPPASSPATISHCLHFSSCCSGCSSHLHSEDYSSSHYV